MIWKSNRFDPEKVAEELSRRPEKIPWHRRLVVADWLATQAQAGTASAHIPLVQLLARDPKWEVRKRVAEVLEHLPEPLMHELAGELLKDHNAYVSRAAAEAEQRFESAKQHLDKQKDSALLLGQYSRIVSRHGKTAARSGHAMARTRYRKLVRSLNHDWTSLLASMGGTESLASALTREGHRLAATASQVHQAKLVMQAYVRELSTYTGSAGVTRRAVRLRTLVRHAHELARSALKDQGFDLAAVAADVSVPAALTAVVSQQSLTVALVNLLKNAYEAHYAGGGLVLGPGKVSIEAKAHDDHVTILIKDSGRGIAEEDLKYLRTFIPGQKSNTKPVSSGFGLPTAYEIVMAHDGDLEITSQPGAGTIVTITLPQPQEGQWRTGSPRR